MTDKPLHIVDGDKTQRTSSYYEKIIKKFCGPDYKNLLRPNKRDEIKQFLRNNKTALVTGVPQHVNCFRAEIFYIIVHNNLSAVRTSDSELVKLNFHELGELPDTTIENYIELTEPDFLWIDICTTKNSFIPHQIMLLVNMRDEKGKRTIIYSPSDDVKTWQTLYESTVFIEYLKFFRDNGQYMKVDKYK